MPQFELITHVGANLERCFDLSLDLDLHQKTMSRTGEKAIAGKMSGLIGLGEEVTWRGRHFGVYLEHTSRITVYERPRHFRDEMTHGRFKFFIHDHFFESVPGGTCIRDVLLFASPFGWLGRLVDALIMERYLRRLLENRNQMIKEVAEAGAGEA